MKETFLNWLGMKIYDNSDTFKNIIYGIYYRDVQLPNTEKIKELEGEVVDLKTKINALEGLQNFHNTQEEVVESNKQKKKRKYTKNKKNAE